MTEAQERALRKEVRSWRRPDDEFVYELVVVASGDEALIAARLNVNLQAVVIRRPGYGDHLAATVDPGIHERQEGISAPPGFADAIGRLAPLENGHDHWHVTFTVASRDESAAATERLGAG